MSFEPEFLRGFYPELNSKKYFITFETASSYGNPVSDADRIFLVDIDGGAKYHVMGAVLAAGWGESLGLRNCLMAKTWARISRCRPLRHRPRCDQRSHTSGAMSSFATTQVRS